MATANDRPSGARARALAPGTHTVGNAGAVEAEPIPRHGQPHSLRLTLPPLAALVFGHESSGGKGT